MAKYDGFFPKYGPLRIEICYCFFTSFFHENDDREYVRLRWSSCRTEKAIPASESSSRILHRTRILWTAWLPSSRVKMLRSLVRIPVSNVFGFFGSEYFYFWILFSIKIFLAIFILVRTRDEPMASVPAPHATLKSASRLRLFFEWLPFRFPFSLAWLASCPSPENLFNTFCGAPWARYPSRSYRAM